MGSGYYHTSLPTFFAAKLVQNRPSAISLDSIRCIALHIGAYFLRACMADTIAVAIARYIELLDGLQSVLALLKLFHVVILLS